jgi:hypothetical protein
LSKASPHSVCGFSGPRQAIPPRSQLAKTVQTTELSALMN